MIITDVTLLLSASKQIKMIKKETPKPVSHHSLLLWRVILNTHLNKVSKVSLISAFNKHFTQKGKINMIIKWRIAN